ncbi:hypothetical protein COOONC_27863 [Cooperia oncophora]
MVIIASVSTTDLGIEFIAGDRAAPNEETRTRLLLLFSHFKLDEIPLKITALLSEELVSTLERVNLGVEPAVCDRDAHIEGDVVVRARGLPWQASDCHVAQFFAGLEIAPGGIALCLSAEGRRNGEALVRFKTPEMRELALKRHRHFLLSRY